MFGEIDPILQASAEKLSLCWLHEYRGEEVRSAEVSLGAGRFAQLWVEYSQPPGTFVVCAWDRKSNRFRAPASVQELSQTLAHAVAVARSWHATEHAS